MTASPQTALISVSDKTGLIELAEAFHHRGIRLLSTGGSAQAIEDAGRSEEMFLVGVDGQKEALLAIMEDTNYAATGLNNSDQIGRAAFHRLMAILAGAEPPKETVLPSPLITIDNVVKHYDPDSVF